MLNIIFSLIKGRCSSLTITAILAILSFPCIANPHQQTADITSTDQKKSSLIENLVSSSAIDRTTLVKSSSDRANVISPNTINNGANIAEVLFVLLGIVAFILIIAWLMKRVGYTGMPKNQVMNIKACLSLTSKERLMLVDIGGEQVVIGVAPGFVGHIKSIDTPLDVNSAHLATSFATNDFSATLKNIISGSKNNKQSLSESNDNG